MLICLSAAVITAHEQKNSDADDDFKGMLDVSRLSGYNVTICNAQQFVRHNCVMRAGKVAGGRMLDIFKREGMKQ